MQYANAMLDWNLVVSLREGRFNRGVRLLREFGEVEQTGFYNVLVVQVAEIRGFLEALRTRRLADPEVFRTLARVMPVTERFRFDSPQEFETRAVRAALAWAPKLEGKAFHVRMHRRGLKGVLHSPSQERLMDEALLGKLAERGTPGRIDFHDPDAVIAVETVRDRAGLAFWTRDDLQRHSFLRDALRLGRHSTRGVVARLGEALPDMRFRLELPDGREVLSVPPGTHHFQPVHLVPGNKVVVEIIEGDPASARILHVEPKGG